MNKHLKDRVTDFVMERVKRDRVEAGRCPVCESLNIEYQPIMDDEAVCSCLNCKSDFLIMYDIKIKDIQRLTNEGESRG